MSTLIANTHRRAHHSLVFGRRVKVLVSHLVSLLPDQGELLDVGCGDGSVAAEIVRQRPQISCTGIDTALRPHTHIAVSEFDGKKIPRPDNSVDGVMFVDVLHHADDAPALLAEARRVSRKWVIIKDHYQENAFDKHTLRFMDWVGNSAHGVSVPDVYWSRERWGREFGHARLTTDTTIDSLGLYPLPFAWIFDRGLHFISLLTPHD